MIILIGSLLAVGIVLAIYALLPIGPASKEKRTKKPYLINNPTLTQNIAQDQQSKLGEENSSLRLEMEKLRADYVDLKRQAQVLMDKEINFNAEISRRQEWITKSESAYTKAKEANLELERKFIAKEKELQHEFEKSVDLGRQIREITDKFNQLEKENKKISDEAQFQKMQIEKLAKELKEKSGQIQSHVNTISEIKKKEEESQWVSKADFNKLNDEYTKLENELGQRDEKLRNLIEELVALKNQLKSKEHFEQPAGQPEVNSEETQTPSDLLRQMEEFDKKPEEKDLSGDDVDKNNEEPA